MISERRHGVRRGMLPDDMPPRGVSSYQNLVLTDDKIKVPPSVLIVAGGAILFVGGVSAGMKPLRRWAAIRL